MRDVQHAQRTQYIEALQIAVGHRRFAQIERAQRLEAEPRGDAAVRHTVAHAGAAAQAEMVQRLQLAERNQIVRVKPRAVVEADGLQVWQVRVDVGEEDAYVLDALQMDAAQGEMPQAGRKVGNGHALRWW